jgi:hypothetical protein
MSAPLPDPLAGATRPPDNVTRSPQLPPARFPDHARGCTYPFDHCNCDKVPFADTEVYRRRRDKDLGALGSRRIVSIVPLAEILDTRGHVVDRKLRSRRRQAKNRVVADLHLSPRQLRKLKKRVQREERAKRAALQKPATAETNILTTDPTPTAGGP